MEFKTYNTEKKLDLSSIPWWVKTVITIFTCSVPILFFLSAHTAQGFLLSLPDGWMNVLSFGFALLGVLISVTFWLFPNTGLSQFMYWSIRLLGKQISIFALLGIVILVALHISFLSVPGGISVITLTLLFLMGWLAQPAVLNQCPVAWMRTFFAKIEERVLKVDSVPAVLPDVAVALLPILLTSCVIYFGLNAKISDYGPYSLWNDETGYWVWIRSFNYVGLDVGYNSPNELFAPADFNHYGEGSPVHTYLYGMIARIIGWSSQLPILINFLILALAIFFFVHFTKSKPIPTLFVGLITVLVWPILLFLPLTTQETLNQAIGFVLAAIFYKFLSDRAELSFSTRVFFVSLVYLAALTRLSWGLFLIPAIFYSLNGTVFRRVLLAVLLGLALFVSVILVTNYLVPPSNSSIFQNFSAGLFQGPRVLLEYGVSQFLDLFAYGRLTPNLAIMFQIAVILVWNLVRIIRSIRTQVSLDSILQSRAMLDVFNMASLTTAGLFFYLQEGFYRTFTPSLLIVYLLQAVKKDYKLLLTLLSINVVFLHSYLTFPTDLRIIDIIRADYQTEFAESTSLESEMEKWIDYDLAAQTPWCNTLLIPLDYYDQRLIVIPPGIGISYILETDTIETPLKSKYLLFDRKTRRLLSDRLNVKLLGSYSIGNLYYNFDSGCSFHS